jgi:serine/threonine protein phosphatase PrpC
VLAGRTLVVANAGDSRGVLCRSGAATALSEDHKPTQVGSDASAHATKEHRCMPKNH